MTSTRLAQYRLATNPEFIGIVTASVLTAAANIRNEDPETPNHANRLVMSNTVFLEIGQAHPPYTTTFVWLAAMNPSIQGSAVVGDVVTPASVADNDVDFVVSSVWDQIAGDQ